MQPYINPNFFNQPYQLPQPNQYQSYVPQYQQTISGKYVNDFNEVTANDVQMDGKPSVFVKNDRSEMQIREWSPSGQIVTTAYKPILATDVVNANISTPNTQNAVFDAKTDVLEPLFERIDELEKKIDKISRTSTTRNKKEVSEDE